MTKTKSPEPEKYLDAKQIRVNPAWIKWDEANETDDEAREYLLMNGIDPNVYLPEEDKAIPPEGTWIIVVEEPSTELRSRFRIPPLSMWRARPHTLGGSGHKVPGYGTVRPVQAVITTPGGDLHLWAHEYVVAKNPLALAADPDAELHPLGGEPVIDEDQLFYLMSRGIPHRDAVLMLFDKIESFDFVYVTFPEEVTSMLEGAGQSLNRHIQLNPREKRDTA